MRASEFLTEHEVITELFEPGKHWQWKTRKMYEVEALFQVGNVKYRFYAHQDLYTKGEWRIEFSNATAERTYRKMYGLTGTGNSAEVMSVVADIMRTFLQEKADQIRALSFSADEPSRLSLYLKMVKRLLPDWEVDLRRNTTNGTEVTVTRPQAQVIDETTEQDQIIVHIADAATQRLIDLFTNKESSLLNLKTAFANPAVSRRDRLTWLSGLYLRQLYLPQTNDPVINKMINTVKISLQDRYSSREKNNLGSFWTTVDGICGIDLFLPAIVNAAKGGTDTTANELRSTLIHEMQHAIDYIKSKGKFNTVRKQSNTPIDSQERYANYLKLPEEVNARFTQAILDIAVQYNKIAGPHRLQDLIKNAFEHHRLNVVDPKQYQRLMTRAYKFFTAMQNSPKTIEPKSLARRAIAWITSSPTSVIKEAPLPPDWDPQEFQHGKSSFKSRLAYALERAKRLGGGSSRVAMTIEYEGRQTVLKIAKNGKGLAQNEAEASILDDGYASQLGIMIPIIDYDKESPQPLWIQTELAQKANENQLCSLMGCTSLEFLINYAESIGGLSRPYKNPQVYKDELAEQGFTEDQIETCSEYASTLADLGSSFDVRLQDFGRGRATNWGIYQGKPVVIDVGFTKDVWQGHYRR